ncbi:MAG: PilZ domain-containing protein [Sphingomonadales bacterium]|nr:PilZ domain-containing protein [Sphingomonadales bacterium]
MPEANATPDERSRKAMVLVCDARQGLHPWSRVRIDDMSPGGFRLIWPSHRLDPRQPLRLRVPGMQMMTAQIRWIEPVVVGCAFATPLHVAVFEHLVREARRQGSR